MSARALQALLLVCILVEHTWAASSRCALRQVRSRGTAFLPLCLSPTAGCVEVEADRGAGAACTVQATRRAAPRRDGTAFAKALQPAGCRFLSPAGPRCLTSSPPSPNSSPMKASPQVPQRLASVGQPVGAVGRWQHLPRTVCLSHPDALHTSLCPRFCAGAVAAPELSHSRKLKATCRNVANGPCGFGECCPAGANSELAGVARAAKVHRQALLAREQPAAPTPTHAQPPPASPTGALPPAHADNCACENGLLQCYGNRKCMKLCALTSRGCHPSVNGGNGCRCPSRALYCNPNNNWTCQAACPRNGPCGSGCTCPSGGWAEQLHPPPTASSAM